MQRPLDNPAATHAGPVRPPSRTTVSSSEARPRWRLTLPRGDTLELGERPLVMGILNVTPDSFSDGGRHFDPQRAVERGLALVEQGADLLDLGAESTRPGGGVYGAGAAPVDASEELRRLTPVLKELRRQLAVPISIDTRKGEVAQEVLAAGADLINDVSALADPRLATAVAAHGCPVVLMHSRGEIPQMQKGIRFSDVVAEVRDELGSALRRALDAGIEEHRVVLDPGIGFGKTAAQSLRLIARLDELADLGRPLLLGASRKSFMAPHLPGAGPGERLAGSLAAAAWGASRGAAILRVHDVADTVRLLALWRALETEAGGGER